MKFLGRKQFVNEHDTMTIFGRKVRIANISIRKKKDTSVSSGSTLRTTLRTALRKNPAKVTPPQPQQQQEQQPQQEGLSPISALVSKFIADNARKTHDSIKDEKERRDFLSDLRETLKSIRDGKERPPRRNLSAFSSVIDFFAETTESTLCSIEDEEERIDFEEHLTRELFQNLDQETTTTTKATTSR